MKCGLVTANVAVLLAFLAPLQVAAQPLVIQEPDRFITPPAGYYWTHHWRHGSRHRHHDKDAAGARRDDGDDQSHSRTSTK
jgi:hypothetical protein